MIEGVSHGIARYVRGLASGLVPERYEVCFLLREGVPLPPEMQSKKVLRASSKFLHPQEWIEIPRILRSCGASVFHSPSFASFPRLPCPWVVTVHDLNHLRFGSVFQKLYYRYLLKSFCKNAAEVVTVSETVRRELSAWLSVDERQIEVALNGIDAPIWISESRVLSILAQRGLERGRFFLSVSSSKPHKNLPLLLRAYARSGVEDWPLVLTTRLEGSVPSRVVTLGGVSDEEASALMSSCGGFLFPSLYEGFGRPSLEAAVSGARLAVSDIPVHREALRQSPGAPTLWVGAEDEAGWSQAFRSLRSGEVAEFSPEQKDSILAAYAPEELAKVMDRIYRRVLGL
jgi:glycosyltransferase involved in cell wall biosynthesis